MPPELPSFTPKTSWYKSTGGIVFLSILGLFLSLVIVFLLLTAYYSWQSKYGDTTAIETSLYHNFTSLYGEATSDGPLTKQELPLEQFIQPTNPTRGPSDAPLTIIAFIDLECPYSQQSYPIVESILKRYEPAVQIIFKHFPIAAIHPNALTAAHTAECVNEQRAFWSFYDLAFLGKSVTPEDLDRYTNNLSIDLATQATCEAQKPYTSRIEQDIKDGLTLGVRGTPTYFIGQTKIEGVIDPATWDVILIEELKKLTEQSVVGTQ